MAEVPRFSIVLLLIALATLATDVTRLVLEWSPSHPLQDAIRKRMELGQPGAYRPATDGRMPDPAPKDPQQRRVKPADAFGERGRRGDPHESRPAPFTWLPPDFSSKRAPWCMPCRQPQRRFEWWRFEW